LVSGLVMKNTILGINFLFIISLCAPAWGQSHFVIKNQEGLESFAEKQLKSKSMETLSLAPNTKNQTSSTIEIDLPDENPVYREIAEYFQRNSGAIAQEQLDEIEQSGGFQAWGGLNHIGLSYSKGFGTFSVELRRDVAPDLFSDDLWIATDQFDLYISASQLLGNLRDEAIIDITDEQLGLFAGVTFKRSYTYVHYEESYQKALSYNLDKLFFSFLNFRSHNFLQIEKGELLKKEDSLSYAIGAAGNGAIATGIGAHFGALVKYDSLAHVTLQGVADEEKAYEGEWLRINSEKSSEFTGQVSVGVIADFLGLLQVSLLKYDFSYSFKESYNYGLSFNQSDRELLENQSEIGGAVSSILKHKEVDEHLIAPYLVSLEERQELSKDSRYELLLFGGKKKAKTTHYKITKDNILHSFFSHNFESATYKQNIFSKLFDIILNSYLNLSSIINNSEERSRTVNIQYKDSRNLIESQEDLIMQQGRSIASEDGSQEAAEDKISINFIRKYYAYKGTSNNRKELVENLEKFSGVDPYIIDEVEDGLLDKSLNFYSKYSMTQEGINHFNNLDVNKAYSVFEQLCDDSRPKGFFGWLSSLFSRCETKLKKEYDLYQIEWSSRDLTAQIYKSCEKALASYKKGKFFFSSRKKRKFMSSCTQQLARKSSDEKERELPVWRLTKFMDTFLTKAESKVYYFQLFGLSNVHVYGQVSGTTSTDQSFIHYFSEGNFKGIDLVTNFEKENGLKTSLELN